MALKFCAVGDSLIQGFQNLAVGDPTWSFPAIIARAAGLTPGTTPDSEFRVPATPSPSLPFDVREALDAAERMVGPTLGGRREQAKLLKALLRYALAAKRFHEGSVGMTLPGLAGVYHNLGLFGMTTFESAHLSSVVCDQLIDSVSFWRKSAPLPSASQFRIARRVLNPDGKRPHATQLDNLDFLVNGCPELGLEPEPLDAVILWLGANDCLGTVVDLQVIDMENQEPGQTVADRRRFNLTSQRQFSEDYAVVANRVEAILRNKPTRVFVATVPDVTIPPLARGIRRNENDSDFAFYGRFFVPDGACRLLHETLSVPQIQQIKTRVEAYNQVIANTAIAKGWELVRLDETLEKLRVRNLQIHCPDVPDGAPLRDYYADKPDHPLLQLDPLPSLLMLETAADGRRLKGGLTSLDGIHPSTLGYGLVAEVFLEAMAHAGIADADPNRVPWQEVIAADCCLPRGPALWNDVMGLFASNSAAWDALYRPVSSKL